MKPTIVNFLSHNNITRADFRELVSQHFDVEPYDSNKTYDRASTVFVINPEQYYGSNQEVRRLVDEGYKFVIENLQEANWARFPNFDPQPNILYMYGAQHKSTDPNHVEVPMFFWYSEQRAWSGSIIDYRNINRTYTPAKKFLLLMQRVRDFRTKLYNRFATIADQGIISYVDYGVRIPGDIEQETFYFDRYVNPEWYNNTQFSVVVETQVTIGLDSVFITEKSMKPFAFRHPFISLSCKNTLKTLQNAGFVTYDNIFSEAYDKMFNYEEKINPVFSQVADCNTDIYSNETRRRIDHNYHWFYSREQVDAGYTRDVIMPILHFVNNA